MENFYKNCEIEKFVTQSNFIAKLLIQRIIKILMFKIIYFEVQQSYNQAL